MTGCSSRFACTSTPNVICARPRPGYYDALSADSKRSLALQGGTFSATDAAAFIAQAVARTRRRTPALGRRGEARRAAHPSADAFHGDHGRCRSGKPGLKILLNLLAGVGLLVWGTHIVRTGILRIWGGDLRRLSARERLQSLRRVCRRAGHHGA